MFVNQAQYLNVFDYKYFVKSILFPAVKRRLKIVVGLAKRKKSLISYYFRNGFINRVAFVKKNFGKVLTNFVK